MNQQLLDFIAKQRAMGVVDATIQQQLLQAGWNEADVSAAIGVKQAPAAGSVSAPAPQSRQSKQAQQTKSSPLADVHAQTDGGVPTWHKSTISQNSRTAVEKEMPKQAVAQSVPQKTIPVQAAGGSSNGGGVVGNQAVGGDTGGGDDFGATGNLGFRYILGRTWEIFKLRWLRLFLVMLVPVVPMVLITFGAGLLLGFGAFTNGLMSSFLWLPVALVTIVVMALVQSWAGVAQIEAIRRYKESVGVREMYKLAWPKVLPFLVLSMLSGLVTMGGFIFLFVPGILFALWYYAAPWVLIDEGVGGATALLKSKHYVRGHLGRVFFNSILFALLLIGLMIPFGLLLAVVVFFLGDALTSSVGTIVEQVMNIIFLPFASIPVILSFVMFKEMQYMEQEKPFEVKKRSKVWVGLFAGLGVLFPIVLIFSALTAIDPAEQMGRARDESVRSTAVSVQNALERYHISEGEYPASLDNLEDFRGMTEERLKDIQYDPKGDDYELCVDYEVVEDACVSSEDRVGGSYQPTMEEVEEI